MFPVASAQIGAIARIGSMIMNPGIQDIVKSAASFVSDIIQPSHSQHREEDMRFIKLKPYSSVRTHKGSLKKYKNIWMD